MTREEFMQYYRIYRYNNRTGGFHFKVKIRRWKYLWWYSAYEMVQVGLTDTARNTLYFKTYDEAMDWINVHVHKRMANYNSQTVTIDKFEPLVKNELLDELINLIEHDS